MLPASVLTVTQDVANSLEGGIVLVTDCSGAIAIKLGKWPLDRKAHWILTVVAELHSQWVGVPVGPEEANIYHSTLALGQRDITVSLVAGIVWPEPEYLLQLILPSPPTGYVVGTAQVGLDYYMRGDIEVS